MRRYEDIVLDRTRLIRVYTVDAEVVQAKLAGKIRESEMLMLAEEDAYQRRLMLDAFGKHEIWKVSCPATWWEHLKLALRTRWPRLFRRLKFRQRTVEFDSGWVAPDIAVKVSARHCVIPYVIGPNVFEEIE